MRVWLPALLLLLAASAASAIVELTSFVATPGDGRMAFTWSTSREINNYYFVFTRNGELSPFITGHGTSFDPHEYSWTDSSLTNGEIYYYTFYAQSSTDRDSLRSVAVRPPHRVCLDNLRAVPIEERISLLWETYSEMAQDHFEILRDGVAVGELAPHNRYWGQYYYVWSDSQAVRDQPYTYTVVGVAADGERDLLGTVSAALTPAAPAEALLPRWVQLSAYPNPFNPATTLAFTLPREGAVRLAVYDLLGREVSVLLEGARPAGTHSVRWDGSAAPAGLYFARLEAPGLTLTQKLLLAK